MFGAIAAIIIFYMIGKFIKDNKESKNRKDVQSTETAIRELERQRDMLKLKERINTLERELELTQRQMRQK